MRIEKYSFKQTDVYTEEHITTLTELYAEMPQIAKSTIKEWVLSGDNKHGIIKGGKIKLFKKQ